MISGFFSFVIAIARPTAAGLIVRPCLLFIPRWKITNLGDPPPTFNPSPGSVGGPIAPRLGSGPLADAPGEPETAAPA